MPSRDLGVKVMEQLRDGLEIVPTDNVGCLLSYVGYDAIVPGRHDFYYGAERLLAMARLIASLDRPEAYLRPVQMLAANLLIKASWTSGHSPIPESQKRLPFESKPSTTLTFAFPQDGKEVLPWLSHLEIKLKTPHEEKPPKVTPPEQRPQAYEAVLIGPERDLDESDWSVPRGSDTVALTTSGAMRCWASNVFASGKPLTTITVQVAGSCGTLLAVRKPLPAGTPEPLKETQESLDFSLALTPIKPLQPGYYKLCVWQVTGQSANQRPVCSRFTVATPFFQFPWTFTAMSGSMPELRHQKGPLPYLVKTVCSPGSESPCPGATRQVALRWLRQAQMAPAPALHLHARGDCKSGRSSPSASPVVPASAALLKALASAARENFVGPGPWKVLLRVPGQMRPKVAEVADPIDLYQHVAVLRLSPHVPSFLP